MVWLISDLHIWSFLFIFNGGLHLRYMAVVFASPLLGPGLLKAPLNEVLRNGWPACWQILHFLFSPYNKFLLSEEQPSDSNSHPYLDCDQDWERVTFLLTPLWVSLSVT